MEDNKDEKENKERIFFEELKTKVEAVLLKAARTDLDGTNGLNELALKFIILGTLADKIQKGEIEVTSEHEVQKSENRNGFVDLFIVTEFGNIMIELKYLPLGFMKKVEPLILSLNNPWELSHQLMERRNNFLKLSTEDKKAVHFQVMDEQRIYRTKLVQNNISFFTNFKNPHLFTISVESMIKLAKAQVLEYNISDWDDVKRYAIVGAGPTLFIEKVETTTPNSNSTDDTISKIE